MLACIAKVNWHILFYANRQKSEEKRGGSGSHNWGNVKDEATYVGHASFFHSQRSQTPQ